MAIRWIRALVPLAAGLLALIVGTAFGWDPRLLEALVSPPALVRAALVAGSTLLGIWLLAQAVTRMSAAMPAPPASAGSPAASPAERDLGALIRGVRLAFLAVAAFAAAAGWILASPLPLVLALVIAGIDVVETSFLLLVVSARREA